MISPAGRAASSHGGLAGVLRVAPKPGPRVGASGACHEGCRRLCLRCLWLSSSETAPNAVISLQPPWPITFQGQAVTLTCHVSPFESPGETTWFHLYHDKETSRQTPDSTWVVWESGQYRCQAGGSRPSSPVHLDFSTGKREGKQ